MLKNQCYILYSIQINQSQLYCLFDTRLADTQIELDSTKNKSATTLLATEDEILLLKAEWVRDGQL